MLENFSILISNIVSLSTNSPSEIGIFNLILFPLIFQMANF